MASVLGLDAGTFRNTGTIASPTWDEIGLVKDETLNLNMALADITTRAAAGFRLQRGTLIEGSVDLQIRYDPGDADFIAIKDAFFNRTQEILGVFDGDVTTTGTWYGLHSAGFFTNFSQARPLEDIIVVDVTFTLDVEDATSTAPAWVTITTP